jgi:hypothetical protein
MKEIETIRSRERCCTWEDSIGIVRVEVGRRVWTGFVWLRIGISAVKGVMNIWVRYTEANFLIGRGTTNI